MTESAPQVFDVVIVGGGIAGNALASVLARGGKTVLVLERSKFYVDRVRGEYMQPWGVAEARRLGLLNAFLNAGAAYHTTYVPYDETLEPAEAEVAAVALDKILPDVSGTLGVGHPSACEALSVQAAEEGAQILHGIQQVDLEIRPSPLVRYTKDGHEIEVKCRLIVGADGRDSTVRRQARIEIHATEPRLLGSGLLISELRHWPENQVSIGTEGELVFFILPQKNERARIYLMFPANQRLRFAGPSAAQTFLNSFPLACVPGSERIAQANPTGPCATFPMNDTWTDKPLEEGLALVGDAAGYSDPHLGQGLSVAMRDVRVLSELLLASEDWSARALYPYAAERGERMRRLRFCNAVATALRGEFGPEARQRRRVARGWMQHNPELALWRSAAFAGPETAPPSALDQRVADQLFAPASGVSDAEHFGGITSAHLTLRGNSVIRPRDG